MKKLIVSVAMAVAVAFGAFAQRPFVQVSALSDNILRIRTSTDGEYPESLMERYGIVKTDWEKLEAQAQLEGDNTWLVTKACKVALKGKTVVVERLDGTPVTTFTLVPSSDPSLVTLADSINARFSNMNVASNGGIIGDDNGKFSEKDKAESGDPAKSSMVSFTLAEGERFYGGGSTSREHIQHRGEMLRMWSTYQHTEIPMPFMMSSKGWGVYDNSTRKSYFDIGCTNPDVFNIYDTAPDTDIYVFVGDSMPDVLNFYTQLTGRSYVLPKWAYGLCFGPNMRENQFDILNDAVHFRQAEVPCDLFWLEPQWMEKRYDFSTAKKFNSQLFSVEPYWLENKYPKQLYHRLFIGKLRSMGFHLGLWLCEEYDLSITEEDQIAAREGRAQSGQEHWMDHLTTFMDLGVEGFKLDPARTIDEHTFWDYYNGRSDKEMHNLNQVLLPKQMAELGRRYNGKRTWHHYCGGWSGTQHWGASTSGDNGGGKTALFDQLNLGNSGFLNTSCDVMSVERSLEMQSLHFGLFLPWVQINSWFSLMHPFYYNEHEQGMYRDYVKLRYSLLPYIYSAALESAQNGMPIVRSMPLMFPQDRNVDDCCYQYMFGQNFCLGIFTNDIYLPEGTWYDVWTGEKISSKGETFTRSYPDNRAGLLFVRGGAIVPCMKDVQYVGSEPLDHYILKLWPEGETSYILYEDDGETYAFENGALAATTITSSTRDASVCIAVEPVTGSYSGMPGERSYSFEIALDSKPSKVSINGKTVKNWQWEDGKLLVDGPKASITQRYTVVVK